MLSGEGNENGEKTAIGLTDKKATLLGSTLFCTVRCRCFVRLKRETSRNFRVTRFMEEMSYVFLFIFFSLPLISTLVAARISYFSTAATKFSCCSSNKKMSSLSFLSLSLAVCRYTSLAFGLLSLFLCLSPSLYSKFVEMTINLSLIRQHGCRNNFCFPFSSLLTL